MSGLFGGGGGSFVNETPRISSLRIQTSAYGGCIPVVLGKQRVTGNLLNYCDLQAIRHEQSQSAGGKSGGEVTSTSIWYTYRYSIQIGICEGPAQVGEIWMLVGDTKLKLSDNNQYGWAIYTGETPNDYSSVLASRHPEMHVRYAGLCNLTSVDMGEFEGDNPPAFSFEVEGFCFDAGIGGADPADAINAIITDTRWGASAPESVFPVATSYGDYAVAMGWAIGLELAEQRPAADWVQAVLDQTNAAPVWAADHLQIVPFGDTAISANGRTWEPSVAPVYDLTDDDFIGDAEGPVRVTRKADSDTFNIQPVEFRNSANEYNIEVIEGSDPASVAMFGPKKNKTTIKAHGLRSAEAAGRLADVYVRRVIRTRNGYKFTLPWTFCRLLPMDIVTLTEPDGMTLHPVRLTSVTESTSLEIECEAEDFPAGAGHAALLPRQPASGYIKDFNTAPGATASPVIFEPPVVLSGQPEVWLGACGGASWGGANVWISLDGITYKNLGYTPGRARMGVLTAELPLVSDPDPVSTLAVDLTQSSSTLTSVTAIERDTFATLSWVGGELVAYQSADLTGPNAYDLTGLRRGIYATPVAAHAIGTKYMRLDTESVFRMPYGDIVVAPDGAAHVQIDGDDAMTAIKFDDDVVTIDSARALIGRTLYIKLQSFNLFGGGVEPLEDVTPTLYTMQGAPMGKVMSLALSKPWDGKDCHIKWDAMVNAASYTLEVWAGSTKRRTVPGIGSTSYAYTWEQNKADGGPYRSLEFRLVAISPNGASTAPAILTVANAQMPAPTGLSVTGNGPVLAVMTNKPTTPDYAGTRIWISDTTGFDPLTTAPVQDGTDWFLESVSQAPGQYYVRVAHYDAFGVDSLNISSEVAVTYVGAIGGIPQVADASTLTTLASPAHWAVYDLTTKKIWRWNATSEAYTKAADGGDLVAASVAADKLAVAQLSAITADIGDVTAGTVHSPDNAVELDLLNKRLRVRDAMGVERFRAGLLPDGSYGAMARSADGSKTAVLTPDVGTIISQGLEIMPTTLTADGNYELEVLLDQEYDFDDLFVIVDAAGITPPRVLTNWHSLTVSGFTVTAFNTYMHPSATYKEEDGFAANGRPKYKTHTVSNITRDYNSVSASQVIASWYKGSATSGDRIYLSAYTALNVYDRNTETIKNLIELSWPLKVKWTVFCKNFMPA